MKTRAERYAEFMRPRLLDYLQRDRCEFCPAWIRREYKFKWPEFRPVSAVLNLEGACGRGLRCKQIPCDPEAASLSIGALVDIAPAGHA